ncbi:MULTISPECIES: hypothetical protein [Desulfonatronospira]|uniref:hypothetical protein n=1 Tax=Desulfonatronospira TaxID=488937 RepID=UPI00129482A6|nr:MULTISPECIES: hypothetical protein [Desulfonatronospira]
MEEIQRGKQDKQSAAPVKSTALSFGISQGKPEAADCINHPALTFFFMSAGKK